MGSNEDLLIFVVAAVLLVVGAVLMWWTSFGRVNPLGVEHLREVLELLVRLREAPGVARTAHGTDVGWTRDGSQARITVRLAKAWMKPHELRTVARVVHEFLLPGEKLFRGRASEGTECELILRLDAGDLGRPLVAPDAAEAKRLLVRARAQQLPVLVHDE